MTGHEAQPQELSTARGNFLMVSINLATGKTRVLDDAEAAHAATDATRRRADKHSDLLVLSSSAL